MSVVGQLNRLSLVLLVPCIKGGGLCQHIAGQWTLVCHLYTVQLLVSICVSCFAMVSLQHCPFVLWRLLWVSDGCGSILQVSTSVCAAFVYGLFACSDWSSADAQFLQEQANRPQISTCSFVPGELHGHLTAAVARMLIFPTHILSYLVVGLFQPADF